MAYTPFAVLATSMMFLMFISPLDVYPESVNQDIGSVETVQTLDSSIENSFSESFGITVNEHLREYNEGLNSPVTDAQTNFSEEYDPDSGSHYSLTQVETDMNDLFQSGARRELNLDSGETFNFAASGLTIESNVSLNYNMTDNLVGSINSFDRTVISQASIDGAKDPFAEFNAGENVEYSYCGFDKPAYYAGSGSSSSNSVISGEAIYRPDDISEVSNKADKVLFIESVDNYGASLGGFAAVVVQDSSYNSGAYVNGFAPERKINNGENVIIDQNEVFISYFRKILDNECFVESSNAPDVFDRIEDNNVASDQGILTFIGNSTSKGSPNEDYLYYDGSRTSDGSVVNVTGLNSNDNGFDERPWFNLDTSNLDIWGLESLEE